MTLPCPPLLLAAMLSLAAPARADEAPAPAPEAEAAPATAPAAAPVPTRAVLIQPLGPVAGAALSVFGDDLLGSDEIGLELRVLDLNARGVYAPPGRLGAFAQVDYGVTTFLMRSAHVGLRAGPRLALGDGGLEGWAVSPFALAGPTWLRAGDILLARWWMLGLGAEMSRTWTHGPLVIELGGGLYSAANVGYRAWLTSMDDNRPEPLLPVKPVLNFGVGLDL